MNRLIKKLIKKIVPRSVINLSWKIIEFFTLKYYSLKFKPFVIRKNTTDIIDILKLDIEGAEKELFSKNYESWLDKVNVIIIELHDRFKEGCTSTFYFAINRYKWNYNFKQGEKVILIRKNKT